MGNRCKLIVAVIGSSIGLLTFIPFGHPNGHESEWGDADFAHDRARRAVNRGEIMPMARLLERVYLRIPGDLVGVEFERHYGKWVYEFKIVDKEGRLREVYVDAKSGEILSIEDK